MLAALSAKKVPLKRRTFASSKVSVITPALTSLMAKNNDLKTTAQAAFVSYIRSVFLHPNKAVFDVAQLDVEDFASSLGLPTVPRVRMIQKLQKQAGRKPGCGAAVQAGGSKDCDNVAALGSREEGGEPDRESGHSLGDVVPLGQGAEGGGDDEEEDGVGFFVLKRQDVLDSEAAGEDASGHATWDRRCDAFLFQYEQSSCILPMLQALGVDCSAQFSTLSCWLQLPSCVWSRLSCNLVHL
jgi:hypothetical protein